MTEWIATGISVCALCISGVTAWLTLFRKGALRMTQPAVVFFGPDGGPKKDRGNKVFLRTLLFSTSRRSQIIECMHVCVQRGESKQNFSVWVYGDEDLARGSGLYVGQEGIACNHHFLLPRDGAQFSFVPGEYTVSVVAKIVGHRKPNELFRVKLSVTEGDAEDLQNSENGLYFDWGPDEERYHSHVRAMPDLDLPPWLMEMANKAVDSDKE